MKALFFLKTTRQPKAKSAAFPTRIQSILEEFQKKSAVSGFFFRHEFLKHSNDISIVTNIDFSYQQKQIITEFFKNLDQLEHNVAVLF